MKAVVAAFNQEKALVGAFSVITNLRMELFEALMSRYSVIMKSGKGWWMIGLSWTFCLCMGSLVFTVTNLQQNHECTYVFSIAKVSLEFG